MSRIRLQSLIQNRRRNITMGKKNNRRSANHDTEVKQNSSRPTKNSKYPSFALAIGMVSLITGVYLPSQGGEPIKSPPEPTKLKKENIKLRETRSTLAPKWFKGKVKRAYEIAREIPEVLDRLYCYCRCRENFNHKNLLSCYVRTHASQ